MPAAPATPVAPATPAVYGGVFFTLEGDKVTEIFVGAGAQ